MGLDNRGCLPVIIVTGSSRDIGRAIALYLAHEGAMIVVVSRHADACESVAGQIRSRDGQALVVPTDVKDETQVDRLVQATLAHFGRVDGLVNAAGVGLLAPLPETTLEMWRKMKEGYPLGIRVNVLLPSATATRMRLANLPSDDPTCYPLYEKGAAAPLL